FRTETRGPAAVADSPSAPSGKVSNGTRRPSRRRCAMLTISPGRGRKASSSLVRSRTVVASVATAAASLGRSDRVATLAASAAARSRSFPSNARAGAVTSAGAAGARIAAYAAHPTAAAAATAPIAPTARARVGRAEGDGEAVALVLL